MKCLACGTKGPAHHVRGFHLVWRTFQSETMGKWRNSVPCSGKPISGLGKLTERYTIEFYWGGHTTFVMMREQLAIGVVSADFTSEAK